MDVIITLPSNLIQLIKEGKKCIELRKTCPKSFNPQKDVIYICEKRTDYVVGYLTIELIMYTNDKFAVLRDRSRYISVPLDWIADNIKNAKHRYSFIISNSKFFDEPLSLDENFHVNKAPQSFVYTFENYR